MRGLKTVWKLASTNEPLIGVTPLAAGKLQSLAAGKAVKSSYLLNRFIINTPSP